MESYLQGQDLWEIVDGNEVTPLEDVAALKKWKTKAGKATFVIKTIIEDDMLEHIRHTNSPNEALGTFKVLFSRKNDMSL